MRRTILAVSLIVLAACGDGAAGEPVVVRGAWARPTSLASTPGAVYFELEVAEDDVLVGASAASVAAVAELHESTTSDGAMAMHELEHGLALDGGEAVAFEPGGLHVMLVDLTGPLALGQRFELTLVFERAGPVTVDVEVIDR